MKPLLKLLIYVLAIPILLPGSGPVLYSNVGHNVPFFHERGEFSGQVSYVEGNGGEPASGIGIQEAYSVSDKVALISSLYSMKGNDSENNEWEGNGTYFEIGGGLFGGGSKKKFLYEAFAGIGTGGIKNQSLTNSEHINVKFFKPFIQPSFGFSSRYFDIALIPRVAYLSYTSKDDFNFVQDGEQLDPIQYFNKNDKQFVFEPGITIRGGIPVVKLELQYSYSTLGEPLIDYWVVNRDFISIGLRFMVSNRISPQQKP